MSKEDIYDAKIYPLLAEILNVCQEHNIAMVSSFAIPTEDSPDLFCSSRVPDENGAYPAHLGEMARVLDKARKARSGPPMSSFTLTHADGSKTMVTVVGDE